MKLATLIGISITEFWELHPYELNIVAQSYKKRKQMDLEIQQKLSTLQAYQIARWVWGKKLEQHTVNKMLQGTTKRKMNDTEMLEKVKALNALFGGEVKKIG